jgi:hypothetical protein
MSVQILIRRDTALNWTTVNPVLGNGEPGLETDTLKIKYGDGVTAWAQLSYPTVYATPTPAAALTGTVLPSNIVSSSLTSVGTLTNLTVTNPILGSLNGNAASATTAVSCSGTAANATNAISAQVANTLGGGLANQIVYQTGTGIINYITAPGSANTYLGWNGTGFTWNTVPNAGTLSGATLASNILSSNLTSLGTLTSLLSSGSILSSGTAGIGYANGAGGTVTQTSSRTNTVTINHTTGAITLYSTTTTAGQVTTFIVTNSTVTINDIVSTSVRTSTGVYFVNVTQVAAGSFSLSVYTPSAVVSAEAPVINFAVIKGSVN